MTLEGSVIFYARLGFEEGSFVLIQRVECGVEGTGTRHRGGDEQQECEFRQRVLFSIKGSASSMASKITTKQRRDGKDHGKINRNSIGKQCLLRYMVDRFGTDVPIIFY